MPRVLVHDFFPNLKFETYDGKSQTVQEVVCQKKHTIFWVMRFIGCRFCQLDIDYLGQEYGKFEAENTQVFVVLQSSRESITGLKGQLSVPFDVVCDTERIFYRELDIKATATKEDRMPKSKAGLERLSAKQEAVTARQYQRRTDEGEAEQLPALFIVAPDLSIEYVHYAVDSVDIPNIEEMIEFIDQIDHGVCEPGK